MDNAATTSVSDDVLSAMLPYFKEKFGNPSTIYSLGKDARKGVEIARAQVAKAIGAKEKEIIQKAVIGAMGTNKRGNLNKEELRQQLEINIKNKTQLYDDDDNIIVEFNESNRVYSVNKDGDVNKEDSNILMQDSTPR